MKKQVHDARLRPNAGEQTVEERRCLGTDAGKRGDAAEKGGENLGTHVAAV